MTSIFRNCDEFRHGWPIVLSASVGIGLGVAPVPFYTIGVFAPELAREFGWGFGQIMFGIMVMTLTVLIVSPLVGQLADRYGVRKIVLVSIVLFSLSFASFALSSSSIGQFYITWGLCAVLGAGTLPVTWTRVVNIWFHRRKGLALGLALVGTGVFGALLKPFSVWLIAQFGWRTAYVAIAAAPLAIAFPMAYCWFREQPPIANTHQTAVYETGHNLKQTLSDWRFWLLIFAVLPISFSLSGPIPNMENLLAQRGFTLAEVAAIVPLIGVSVLAGRIVGGLLVDYFWAPAVGFILLSLPVFACWLLLQEGLTIGAAMVSVFLIGFASGVEYDLVAFLIARYFGMKSYSAIYGFLYGSFVLGAGLGPTLFGFFYDRTQSYDFILGVAWVVLLIGACSLLALGRYRYGYEQS